MGRFSRAFLQEGYAWPITQLMRQGKFNYSAYFIGSYFIPNQASSSTGQAQTPVVISYNLPLAYLLVGGFYLFLSCIFIFHK